MIADYLRLIVFAAGLLVGVQVPGVVDQYAKRVNAHQIEAARNFAGFQETANRYFGGNVEALIAHHTASADQAFRDEARSIRDLFERLSVLTAEQAAMRKSLIQQIVHVVFRPNREILDETWSEYTYTVPLKLPAVACGVTVGALLAMLVEALLIAGVKAIRPRRIRPANTAHHR
jgi:Protein of unknown function (DUF2937)